MSPLARRRCVLLGASMLSTILPATIASAQTTTPVESPDAQQAPVGSPNQQPGPVGTDQAPQTSSDSATATGEDDAIGGDIVVTGSRIARPTLNSPIPVTTLTSRDLTRTGQLNIGEVLNDLPQLRSTFSQQNSAGNNIGITGLNILDLRGLGASRTLVLVNGRRHVTTLEGEFVVDTNTIPNELVDRVDVVTGGSSAVYGSDAMAGVVNFVLKRNFEGISLNAQGGLADKGDRGTYYVNGTFGKNFADDRGNIAVSLGYYQANPVYYAARDELTGAFSGRNQFQLVDNPALDNTTPDRRFLTGVRSFGYSDGGSFIPYVGQSIRSCANTVPGACLASGFPRVFLFQPDGSLRESNYGTDFRPVGSGNNQGGDGSTLNNTGVLIPGLKRYTANVLGHFDVSEGFKPFFEAKYVRLDSAQTSSPTFAQGGPQGPGNEYDPVGNFSLLPIQLDNAYLTPASRALITSLLPAGSTFFNLNRNNVDTGSRGELGRRETYRFVGGFEGSFNDDWRYDLSVNYGEQKSRIRFTNNRIEQNFFNSIDAVRNGAGQIVCRINQVSVTDPSCVPLNILGEGNASQAALAYINTTSLRTGKATEFVVNGNVVGDLSQLFELPGGPIKFAVGGEYRRETARYAYDDVVESGATFLNAIQPFNPPSFTVKEAYGEIEAPLLKDRPFFEELTVSAAGRVADYKGAVGTVFAWNVNGIYSPVRDIKFRGNYSRSVRAPTLGDLYTTPSQDFRSLDDPCDANFINQGRETRVANCRAAGVPVGFVNDAFRAATPQILSGGNPDLTEEKSRSITAGVVIQPRFVPGLSITADYYNIKISNVISPVASQTILDGCYDGADLNNAFCQLVATRNADGTFPEPVLTESSLNFSGLKAEGVDLDVAYNHRFDDNNRVTLRFVGNYVLDRTDFPYIDDPSRPERIKGELGDPIYAFNVSADYTWRNFTLGYQMRWIGRQSITDWEAQHDTNGVPALDPYYADVVYYPKRVYHAVRASVDVSDKFTFYGGVDNLTDSRPPYGLLGTGDNDAIYDNVGRFLYVGASAKF